MMDVERKSNAAARRTHKRTWTWGHEKPNAHVAGEALLHLVKETAPV